MCNCPVLFKFSNKHSLKYLMSDQFTYSYKVVNGVHRLQKVLVNPAHNPFKSWENICSQYDKNFAFAGILNWDYDTQRTYSTSSVDFNGTDNEALYPFRSSVKLFVPFMVNTGGEQNTLAMFVPCGKCAQCVAKTVRDWSFRVEKDIQNTLKAMVYFSTLTYDAEHLPVDTDKCKLNELGNQNFAHCSNGFLRYEDVQLYHHRLRKILKRWYGINNVKFFTCGEYGMSDKGSNRPHYHELVWFSRTSQCGGYLYTNRVGGKQSFMRDWIKQNCGYVPELTDWRFELICFNCWQNCKRQAFTCKPARNKQATVKYITKYISKQKLADNDTRKKMSELFNVNAVPMFRRFSLGIGQAYADYLAKVGWCDDYQYKVDEIIPTKDGRPNTISRIVPKYIRNRAYMIAGKNVQIALDNLQTDIEIQAQNETVWQKIERFNKSVRTNHNNILSTSKTNYDYE